jgi:hypothetical protein
MRYLDSMTGPLGFSGIALLLLAMLLGLCAGLLAMAVLVSFSIAWYERVNADPAQAGRYHPAWATRLLLAEFGCLLLTLLLRPCGWLPTRIPAGPGRRPPVILLHGLFQNRSCLLPLRWRLRAAGSDRVVSLNTPSWHTMNASARPSRRCALPAALPGCTWSAIPWGGSSPAITPSRRKAPPG